MGLFQKKKTIQTHVDPKLVDALKTYIEQHQALVKEKNEKKPQDSGIRYSSRAFIFW